ncbi:lipoprotein [Williamsoniiplasma luminosum]|uniref:Lipoprotein n=1 Tax=Williamsoniiplasma luminosum TaxID=214888 RepID=A0A2S0NJI9_9MOLU|nr:lipoprotein [Williamsoniiplasma luminosum]AVP49190.1 MAG: hypothetical protein C5T88_01150 [Williamsoniiplasma luminosum]
MKKLLMLLGSISIIVGSVSTVIACDNPTISVQSMFENAIKIELDRANGVTTQIKADKYKKDLENNKIKIKDVNITLNYTSPPSLFEEGSFQVRFIPTLDGKYKQANSIFSSSNVIKYNIQAVFERLIADELDYVNEIKTRKAASEYTPTKIHGIDIDKNYVAPRPDTTGTFQVTFAPDPIGIYQDAVPQNSIQNIINYDDPVIQKDFDARIKTQLTVANNIKTQSDADQYRQDFEDNKIKIKDVEIELKYSKPNFNQNGWFFVIFKPKLLGEFVGASQILSTRNQIEYNSQIAFDNAIKEEKHRADNIKTHIEAEQYKKDFNPNLIPNITMKLTYEPPTLGKEGLFYVFFSPIHGKEYEGANPSYSEKNSIAYNYQWLFDNAIKDELQKVNNIKTQIEAEEYVHKHSIPHEIPDVIKENIYTPPDDSSKPGSFQVIFNPKPDGKYSGSTQITSNKIEIKFDVQYNFDNAIKSELSRASSVKTRPEARDYKKPTIAGVDIKHEYNDKEQVIGKWTVFSVSFSPSRNGKYNGAKSEYFSNRIPYVAIHEQEYLDAIKPMRKKFEDIPTSFGAEAAKNLWIELGGDEGWWDKLGPGDTINTTNLEKVRDVRIWFQAETDQTGIGKKIRMNFSPTKDSVYKDVGKEFWTDWKSILF